jgi:hypothetical protein
MGERREFETREAAEQFAAKDIQNRFGASDAEILTFLNDTQIIGRENVERTVPPGGSPVLIPHFRWVIKNEDLALMDAILDGVRSGASAGFFAVAGVTQVAEWAAIAAIAASVFKLCRNAIRKGKTLEPDTYAVLSTVKALGPMSERTIFESLHAHDKKWTTEAVHAALVALKSMPMTSGEPRQLVAEDGGGEWRAAGL